MKSEKDTKQAYRARRKRCVRGATGVIAILTNAHEELSGDDISRARDYVEDIAQCFHEMNAYWNVLYTGGDK